MQSLQQETREQETESNEDRLTLIHTENMAGFLVLTTQDVL